MSSPTGTSRPSPLVYLAIGLLAGAVMLFEIALVRIFSFTIWHHFAFMVISIALLGFGVSGVLLQIRPGLGAPAGVRAAWYASGFALTAVASLSIATQLPLSPTELWKQPAQLAYLLAFYAAFAVPFFFAGLAIISLLHGYARQVDRLYAADLVGAGACSILSVLAIRPLGAEGTVLAAAAAAALAGALLARSANAARALRASALLAVALAALVPIGAQVIAVRPGPSKGMAQLLYGGASPNARVTHAEWSPLGRVDAIVGGGGVTWTTNRLKGTRSPQQVLLIIDGDAGTPIIPFAGDLKQLDFLDYTISSGALQLFHPKRALVLGSGGGVDVLTALHHGAEHVDAVEINDVIRDLVRGPYAEFGGRLFERDDVTLHAAEGRAFIRSQHQRWDAIQVSLIDTWAASSSGAYALTEGYLYTVEAFVDYLQHLNDAGVLTVTRWVSRTPRETMKLVAVADHALQQLGVAEPRDHIALIGLENLGSLLVKRTPFTRAELSSLSAIAQERGFHFLYAPGLRGDNAFIRYFAAEDRQAFLDGYVYDASPATDDSPFFFQFGRWSDLFSGGGDWSAAAASGRGMLLAVLGQALLASVLLLVLPLWRTRREAPRAQHTGRALAYFFLIGLSFMLVEISLMQRFTLYLGHPVHAVAFVLTGLLSAAGAGSYASKRFAARPDRIFLGLTLLVVAHALLLPSLFHATLGLALWPRLLIGALTLFPLGFLLGMPFPLAMDRLTRDGDGRLMGWAWAANGCASVIGPVLASMLAFDLGFARVTLVAALLYGLAFLAFKPRWGEIAIATPDAAKRAHST